MSSGDRSASENCRQLWRKVKGNVSRESVCRHGTRSIQFQWKYQQWH